MVKMRMYVWLDNRYLVTFPYKNLSLYIERERMYIYMHKYIYNLEHKERDAFVHHLIVTCMNKYIYIYILSYLVQKVDLLAN